MKFSLIIGAIALIAAATQFNGVWKSDPQLLGPTAIVTELESEMEFKARVDTGATTSSIHCERWQIRDGANDPYKNVGKRIRFQIKNKAGESTWLESVVVETATIRTSEDADNRYKVPLRLRCNGIEKEVLVTLNDRSDMDYPVLLGRNFLREDFLVDVAMTETR